MFEIDDNFFIEAGISNLPPAEMQAFKAHVQEEIEIRVGERISDGITTEKMQEFEHIIDDIPGYIESWVTKYAPSFREDALYQTLMNEKDDELTEADLLSEYASMKWLQINRPDFTQIIAEVMNEMKHELRDNSGKIVG